MNTMNLADELLSMEPTQLVKIGARDGSGYFFCGTAKEFIDHIDEYSDTAYDFFKKTMEKASAKFEDLSKSFPEYPETYSLDKTKTFAEWLYMLQFGMGNFEDSSIWTHASHIRGFIDTLPRWMTKITIARKAARAADLYFRLFVPYTERRIVDMFYSSADDDRNDILCIQVEGYECGHYWLMKEAVGMPAFDLKPVSSVLANDNV